ncbi:Transcription factor DIVARICATA [Apostasia shenzhenica]|uniref:Transcription factor MYBS1 n=1 Tax=Apostasia shenzhenica TaxID=1088818 RepID=A0A2I0BHB9_9ASPA|nr:Transcription factor DIVARICATA [Apostasia shenzhenica]
MYGGYKQFIAGSCGGGIPAPQSPLNQSEGEPLEKALPEPLMAPWTQSENKAFEKALVHVAEDSPDRWRQIAAQIPGKTPEDIYVHYLALVHDIALIDSDGVDLPPYEEAVGACGSSHVAVASHSHAPPARECRRKGVPWSEDEHRRFLEGLERFGRGDWRNISRWAVKTRTPTQVASHAQKFFLRQTLTKEKESKRKSIHDIT